MATTFILAQLPKVPFMPRDGGRNSDDDYDGDSDGGDDDDANHDYDENGVGPQS